MNPQFSELHEQVLPYGRMPCPYFLPARQFVWPSAPILPLGDAYQGSCQADPAQVAPPPAESLVDLCNLGYARGRCPRFPQDEGPDAVRFAVVKDADGVISISWVRERDHHPFDHGRLEYQNDRLLTPAAPLPAVTIGQAQAYVSSYLRRTRKERG